MSDKWYKTGNEGIEEGAKKDAQAKARAAQRENRRFWLHKDTEAKCIFIDNPMFFFSEHSLELLGKFGNFFTCLADFDDCPLCLDGDSARYAVAATVIDTSKYETEDGKVFRNQRKLFVAIAEARKNLLKLVAKKGGDIAYSIIDVARGSAQGEPNTGQNFDFVKKANRKAIGKWLADQWRKEGKQFTVQDLAKFLTPFDYPKVFAPKSASELRQLTGIAAPIGGAEDTVDNPVDSNSEPDSLDSLL